MTAVVETVGKNEVPMHEQQYNRYGYGSYPVAGTDERVAGDLYGIDDKKFLLTNERRPRVYVENDNRFVGQDEELYQKVLAMEQHDYDVAKARDKYAVELAKGDEVLVLVYRYALEYGNGQIEDPMERDGVTLYKVGRNASHDFYLGSKDGKLYKAAMCGEWNEKEEYIEDWSDPREVESLQGEYLGHY